MRRMLGLIVAVTLLAGCSESDAPEPGDATDEMPAGEAPQADLPSVYIVATDESYRPQSLYKFYPAEADVGADMPFNLTLKNAGGNTYGHTLIIDELDVRLAVSGEFEATNTVVTAPAGTYTFYCDVGNHRLLGMEGTLTVR